MCFTFINSFDLHSNTILLFHKSDKMRINPESEQREGFWDRHWTGGKESGEGGEVGAVRFLSLAEESRVVYCCYCCFCHSPPPAS